MGVLCSLTCTPFLRIEALQGLRFLPAVVARYFFLYSFKNQQTIKTITLINYVPSIVRKDLLSASPHYVLYLQFNCPTKWGFLAWRDRVVVAFIDITWNVEASSNLHKSVRFLSKLTQI